MFFFFFLGRADKHTLIMDAGKLYVLDSLLSRLKAGEHRVLIYSQMTKMIDLLEVSGGALCPHAHMPTVFPPKLYVPGLSVFFFAYIARADS